ncbi:hypothetical protein GCM10009719_23030 [Nocardioides kribbensis]
MLPASLPPSPPSLDSPPTEPHAARAVLRAIAATAAPTARPLRRPDAWENIFMVVPFDLRRVGVVTRRLVPQGSWW